MARLFRRLFDRSGIEREMNEEMRFHLDMETDDYVRAGMDPAEARRQALMRFGGVERFKEEARMARGERVVEDFVKDVRLALRGLRRSPGFTAVALSMLALGIGANTAIFSVIHAVLLKPLPFQEPDELVQIYETHMAQGWDRFSFSQLNALDLMQAATSFDGIEAASGMNVNLTGDGQPERVGVSTVTPGFFRTLGVTPVLGRTFQESDVGGDEALRVVLLGEDAWTNRFGSDPSIIGKTLQFDDMAYEVVGVLPGDAPWLRSEFYAPMGLSTNDGRDNHFLRVIARLKDGVSIEAARAELVPLAARLEARNAPIDEGMSFRVEPAASWAASAELRQSLWVFMGAVGVLLLIACMNLANLLLARVATRRRQVAMCVALGAGRSRIVRQLLTESAVLGAAGAVLGIGVARIGLDALVALEPGNIPQLETVEINGLVLAFTLGLALATGLLGGLLPALKLPFDTLGETLRDGGRGGGNRSQSRMRGTLVSAETALSLVLLVGAGLLVRSLIAVQGVDPGFDPDGRITFEVNLPDSYGGADSHGFRQEMLERIRGLPAVRNAAALNMRPVAGGNVVMSVLPVGETIESFGGAVSADWRMITDGYFQSMGISLVAGRDLSHAVRPPPAQGESRPPMDIVISRTLADRVWPGEDAVGKQAQLWVTPDRLGNVIGVVEDMRERGPGQDERAAVYFTYAMAGWSPIHFVVHAEGDPRAILPSVRGILADIDASLPLSSVLTMDELIATSTASRRFTMTLLAVFAVVALVLALAGLYGVIADSVHQRAQELGVRVALGASARDVMGLVLSQGMRPALVGIGVGLAVAMALSRVLQSLLFGVGTTDPLTFLAMAALLGLAAFAACWVPARGALRLDPVTVLREE